MKIKNSLFKTPLGTLCTNFNFKLETLPDFFLQGKYDIFWVCPYWLKMDGDFSLTQVKEECGKEKWGGERNSLQAHHRGRCNRKVICAPPRGGSPLSVYHKLSLLSKKRCLGEFLKSNKRFGGWSYRLRRTQGFVWGLWGRLHSEPKACCDQLRPPRAPGSALHSFKEWWTGEAAINGKRFLKSTPSFITSVT